MICFASRITLIRLTVDTSHDVAMNDTARNSGTRIFLSSISSSPVKGLLSIFETVFVSMTEDRGLSFEAKTSQTILENASSRDQPRVTYFP